MTMIPEQWIALLPLLITAATVLLVMLSIAIRRHHWLNATLTVIGLNLALVATVYAALAIEPQEIGPLLVIDRYALFYTGLILIGSLACATLCHAYLEGFPGNKEEAYMLLALAACGAIVLVSSRHLVGFFLGLELMSIPLYALVGYTFRQQHALEAAIKYLVLSAAASATLLFGMAMLYAEAGTMSYTGLGQSLAATGLTSSPYLFAGVALMLIGLAFKLSLAPFHLWTPDVYEGAPAPIGAFLATVSKVAVFAVFLRFLAEAPVSAVNQGVLRDVFSVLAFASIFVGNLLALTQSNIKRLLGYSSIAHFGYVLVAVVAGGVVAFEAVGIYLVTYVVTTLGAFGVVALMSSPYSGKDADAIYDYRGLFWRRPYLTAVMTVMMLSLAGIPLTAGFIGKFYVVTMAVDAQLWWLLGAVVVGSAIGLYYYLRVMIALYLPTPGQRRLEAAHNWGTRAGGIMVIAVAVLMFVLGVYPQPIIELVHAAEIVVFP